MTTTRARAAALGAALLLLPLTGCGDDPAEVAADPVGSPTASSAPTPSGDPSVDTAAIEHPTGPDDVIVRIETGGGFMPVEYAVIAQPSVLLTGDGRLFVPPRSDQQSRLIAMEVAQFDEAQVQQLLGLAEEAGLLGDPPGYADDAGPQVADAPTTTVSLVAGGGTWVHEAYALGFGDDTDGSRQALSDFIGAALAVASDIDTEPFEPAELALFVQPTDLEREVVAWPADDVSLAGAGGCEIVPAGGLVEVLSSASLLASFRQDGALYSVSAAEVLPGDQPCD